MTKDSGAENSDAPQSLADVSTTPAVSLNSSPGFVQAVGEGIGRYRWVICALLFFATTINYIDRQVVGLLATELKKIIGWTETDYGNITAAFSAAYALGLILSGRLMDRFGTKIGYAVSIVIWSLAGMVTAVARTPLHFGLCRSLLGLGEAGNFPAAIKSVAEWFPKKERALATGIFNAGTNVGAIIAPLTVPWIYRHYGWQWAFILTGAIGFLWLALWIPVYRKPEHHPKISRGELAYIQSDPVDPVTPISWLSLIPHRQASAFAIAKYLTDPIWWFYLFWIPKFLTEKHHLDLSTIPLPVVVIYLIADVGSVGGGWLSSNLIKRGWSVNKARKTAMLICALLVTPVVLVSQIDSLWLAVSLIGLAAAAHQGWSANVFSTVSDMFPRRAVGSVVGIGGMSGAMGGVMLQVITGVVLDKHPGDYTINFIVAGSVYLVALAIVHSLIPKLEPVEIDAPIKPVSLGSLVGFGLIGMVFGTFIFWVLGLLRPWLAEKAGLVIFSHSDLITILAIGAATGAVIGMVGGIAICRSLKSRS